MRLQYKWLLNKPFVNGVIFGEQNLSLKCCQSLEQKLQTMLAKGSKSFKRGKCCESL